MPTHMETAPTATGTENTAGAVETSTTVNTIQTASSNRETFINGL